MSGNALPSWLVQAPAPVPDRTWERESWPGRRRRDGFLRRTIRGLAQARTSSTAAQRLAEARGWLQRTDSRVKTLSLVILLTAAGLAKHHTPLLILFALAVAAGLGSAVRTRGGVGRVWLLAVAFAAIVVLPATLNWVRPGRSLVLLLRHGGPVRFGPWVFPAELTLTREGLSLATLLVLRVAVSSALTGLTALTTAWPDLLRALRIFGIPKVLVATLEMCQRYLHLLLRTAEESFLARESRTAGSASRGEQGRFAGAAVGLLFLRAYHLSEQVHMAMRSRGYAGEPVAGTLPRWRTRQTLQLALVLAFSVFFLGGDRWLDR